MYLTKAPGILENNAHDEQWFEFEFNSRQSLCWLFCQMKIRPTLNPDNNSNDIFVGACCANEDKQGSHLKLVSETKNGEWTGSIGQTNGKRKKHI